MVNLYGLYMAVVFLWRFRLQVVPLSLGTPYSLCGMTSPRVTVLALFHESVNRLMGTKEIKKKKNMTARTNWTKELKPQTRQKLMQFAPRMRGSLILCLILGYL